MMENDNFVTSANANIDSCKVTCENEKLCKYFKFVPESRTCEMFSVPNRVCVGYLGLSDKILKNCRTGN